MSNSESLTYWATTPDGTRIVVHYQSLLEWAHLHEQQVSLGWAHRVTMDDDTRVAEGDAVRDFPPDGTPGQLYAFLDGTDWCVVEGTFTNLQECIAGCGATISAALNDYRERSAPYLTPKPQAPSPSEPTT